ncbi:hypothetical protein WA026_023573 [Henosepilachna vigintioctopunctata]|uniref:Copper transport protein n=1 Tax=Henosepilachna vigintioctopunctata TaxID=420089 RepID=A0AAW1UWW3_9CUCU
MEHNGHHNMHDMHTGHNTAMPTHSNGHGGHGGMHSMSMSFHFGSHETVLFDQWVFSTVGGLIGSMIGILIMAALYEGLKYFRKGVVNEENQIVQPTMWSKMHCFQTFLHMVQMILSYFLMLIFMTYNVWLCIAIVIGAGIGYFLFGWKKSVIVDVTEHCH